MLQDWVVRADELFVAGATFTQLAWALAYAFVACQALVPGSFAGPGDATGLTPRSWVKLLCLSIG